MPTTTEEWCFWAFGCAIWLAFGYLAGRASNRNSN